MTVKELKEMLNNVPDDFILGKVTKHTVNEKWFGEQTYEQTIEVEVHPIVDLKNKLLILNIK